MEVEARDGDMAVVDGEDAVILGGDEGNVASAENVA